MKKWCPDMLRTRYTIWQKLQIPLVLFSLCFGYLLFGWAGFFWLGAIRLLYCMHMQCFVNSLLHLKPGLPEGVDSSQNIWWLGPLQITAWGENWHGNHHAKPASARFSPSIRFSPSNSQGRIDPILSNPPRCAEGSWGPRLSRCGSFSAGFMRD